MEENWTDIIKTIYDNYAFVGVMIPVIPFIYWLIKFQSEANEKGINCENVEDIVNGAVLVVDFETENNRVKLGEMIHSKKRKYIFKSYLIKEKIFNRVDFLTKNLFAVFYGTVFLGLMILLWIFEADKGVVNLLNTISIFVNLFFFVLLSKLHDSILKLLSFFKEEYPAPSSNQITGTT